MKNIFLILGTDSGYEKGAITKLTSFFGIKKEHILSSLKDSNTALLKTLELLRQNSDGPLQTPDYLNMVVLFAGSNLELLKYNLPCRGLDLLRISNGFLEGGPNMAGLHSSIREMFIATDLLTARLNLPATYLLYQALLEVYPNKNGHEPHFDNNLWFRLQRARKRILALSKEKRLLLGEFLELGQSLKSLNNIESQIFFALVRSRRNEWLEREKSLHGHIVLTEKLETQKPYREIPAGFHYFLDFLCDIKFTIELREGTTQDNVIMGIRTFFEAQGFTVTVDPVDSHQIINIEYKKPSEKYASGKVELYLFQFSREKLPSVAYIQINKYR